MKANNATGTSSKIMRELKKAEALELTVKRSEVFSAMLKRSDTEKPLGVDFLKEHSGDELIVAEAAKGAVQDCDSSNADRNSHGGHEGVNRWWVRELEDGRVEGKRCACGYNMWLQPWGACEACGWRHSYRLWGALPLRQGFGRGQSLPSTLSFSSAWCTAPAA